MDIILLEDVDNVGKKFEEAEVADGYGANFLLPRGKAVVANDENRKRFAKKQAEMKKKREEARQKRAEMVADLADIKVEITAPAGDQDQLFSGVYAEDVAETINKSTQVEVKPEDVALSQPIQRVGEHTVNLEVADTTADIRVTVKASEQSDISSEETSDQTSPELKEEPEEDSEKVAESE
jgi:large subunit ribosomal protein L9